MLLALYKEHEMPDVLDVKWSDIMHVERFDTLNFII